MQPWSRIHAKTTVDRISYRTIVTKVFEMPNGQIAEFGTVWPEGQEFVHVVALTEDFKVIVARMFRVGPELIMDELPGGYVEAGETYEQAAARELVEETGYRAGNITYVGAAHKDAYMNATWHTLIATNCVHNPDTDHEIEAEEHIETRLISIADLLYNAKHDKMTDALGVFIAYDKLMEATRND